MEADESPGSSLMLDRMGHRSERWDLWISSCGRACCVCERNDQQEPG